MKDKYYQLRLSDEERSRWEALAAKEGLDLAKWIRAKCNASQRPTMEEFLEQKKKEHGLPVANPFPNVIMPVGSVSGASVPTNDNEDEISKLWR